MSKPADHAAVLRTLRKMREKMRPFVTEETVALDRAISLIEGSVKQETYNDDTRRDVELTERFKVACRALIRGGRIHKGERVPNEVFGEDVETLGEVLSLLESFASGKAEYEWFDSAAGVWKPVYRLPYTWERELGILWRPASPQAAMAQDGGES
jgi:hypothetical protein